MENKRSAAYEALGDRFERLNDDCGYEVWGDFLLSVLAPYRASKGIDIGCGNGYFTRLFERAGYSMTGYDVSVPMLNRAKALSAQAGLHAEYIRADMRSLRAPSRVDFALAIDDCVNYLPQSDLRAAFARVASCLKKGGVFLFDVSSEYKFREKVANNIFADDREDMTCLWFCSFAGDREVMDVTLFVREADGRFSRRDERQVQYIHREDALRAALDAAGFSVVSVTGHLGESKAYSDRLVFLAERR